MQTIRNRTKQTILVDTTDGLYESHEVKAGKEMDFPDDSGPVHIRTESERNFNVFKGEVDRK